MYISMWFYKISKTNGDDLQNGSDSIRRRLCSTQKEEIGSWDFHIKTHVWYTSMSTSISKMAPYKGHHKEIPHLKRV